MYIVISGCGKIGRDILENLVSEGHDVTAIDTDPAIIEEVNNVYDVMGVCGNGADYETLEEAEINKANLFISATEYAQLLFCTQNGCSSYCCKNQKSRI